MKRPVISFVNLPTPNPLLKIIVLALLFDRAGAGWILWTVFSLIGLTLIVYYVLACAAEDHIDILEEIDEPTDPEDIEFFNP